jgi:glycerol kinase
VFDHGGRIVAAAQQEFPQILPAPGAVEHDPEAIWNSQLAVARDAVARAGAQPRDLAAIGITNQRETTILWDRDSGRPIANAIVWQSRVTAAECDRLKADGLEPRFREKTGLVVDAYFSGTKIKHLLDADAALRRRAEAGEILFGTVDSFLIWRLTGGKRHITDVSNASRTLLFNIHTLEWDDELLGLLDVPRCMLPEVCSSSEVYATTTAEWFGEEVPIGGCAGDQQAATFGQACFAVGSAKNTYGTGCFLLMNTGDRPVASHHGLLTTVGWRLNGTTTYCLEGSVFVAGAAVQWLRDGLGLIGSSAEIERLGAEAEDSGGIVFVPALVGLGAPYWDPHARGAIFGLTRGTTAAHLARATVESMALQSCDVLRAMQQDATTPLVELKADGGASVNDRLLQFQADLLGLPVVRPVVTETTALGAAYLAGLAVGFWNDTADLATHWSADRRFEPTMPEEERERRYRQWQRAVERTRGWADERSPRMS